MAVVIVGMSHAAGVTTPLPLAGNIYWPSIGANIAEAFYAQSDADLIAKLYISRKETGETIYWIELLQETTYLETDVAQSILADCDELLKILDQNNEE